VHVHLQSGAIGRYGPIPAELVCEASNFLAQCRGHGIRANGRHLLGLPSVRDGSVRAAARGAVECAAWDALGQQRNCSVGEFLGAETSTFLPAYVSLITVNVDGPLTTEIVSAARCAGFRGQKWRLPDGPLNGQDGLRRNLRRAECLCAAARGHPVMLEVGNKWSPQYLREFCENARGLPIEWIEEPFPITQLVNWCEPYSICLASGEHCRSALDLCNLLHCAAIGVVQPDAVACGGISTFMEYTQKIEGRPILLAPHGRAMIPALHACAAVGGRRVLEYNPLLEAERQGRMRVNVQPESGEFIYNVNRWLGLWPRT
jgi:L-alanine-DL-glutamate epimerase-like enolase superfamily enzyme